MTTTTTISPRPWLAAEIDLAEARLGALTTARAALETVAPFLPALERQQLQATVATLELVARRTEAERDGHEANLRRVGEAG